MKTDKIAAAETNAAEAEQSDGPGPLATDRATTHAPQQGSVEGLRPPVSQRAHLLEAGLRIMELAEMFRLGGWKLKPGYRRAMFQFALAEVLRRASLNGTVGRIVAVGADWHTMYPRAYHRLIRQHGVPTTAFTTADTYNWALVEQLAPDCTDKIAIEEAQAVALLLALDLDPDFKFQGY